MNTQQIEKRIHTIIQQEGRRPRILLAHLESDQTDRWTKPLAASLAECGFDVDIGPARQTPVKVARLAVDNDVHLVCVGLSDSANQQLVFDLIEALEGEGGADIRLVAGGEVAISNHEKLDSAGVSLIVNFDPSNSNLMGQLIDLIDETTA